MKINEAYELLDNKRNLPSYDEVLAAMQAFCNNSRNVDNLLLWHSLVYNTEKHIYEIWNSDYVSLLAEYIRARDFRAVLEVGAGDGRLSHFLRDLLPLINIVAVDDGSWNIKPVFDVRKMGLDQALLVYKPDLVISSWMPYEEDWTPRIRSCSSVMEYILIGETDGGCCGSDAVWGGHCNSDVQPEYERAGFFRDDLEDLSRLQFCRTDHCVFDVDRIYRHSRTVAFRRR